MTAPARPLLRYLGGKWRTAPWIISAFPPHDIYVEPFGGGASVLLRKPRVRCETYNDLDDELVNLFRVLRDDEAAALLIGKAALTPYAHTEYRAALRPAETPVDRALRALVRSHFGHGTGGVCRDRPTGFRRDGTRGGTNVAGEWKNIPEALAAIVMRMRGVSITQKPALALLDDFDAEGVLIYLDPPYLPETRSGKSKKGGGYHTYAHEMDEADHRGLIERCRASRAMIVISGYPSSLYEAHLAGWARRETAARGYRNVPRTEVLWINPAAVERLGHGPIFEACPPEPQRRRAAA